MPSAKECNGVCIPMSLGLRAHKDACTVRWLSAYWCISTGLHAQQPQVKHMREQNVHI